MNFTGLPKTPPKDASNNGLLDTSIGNREDTASAVGSIHAKLAFVDALVDTATTKIDTATTKIDTVDGNVDTILAREVVVTSTKTLTAQGGGAGKVIDLFTVTGVVDITEIFGECTEATDSTTLTNLLLHLFPAGGTSVDISATGTNCSAMAVGDVIRIVTSKATATQYLDRATALVQNEAYARTVLAAKLGVANTIQAKYTSDAATDVDIKWTIRYRPITANGAIAASA
jgi:hypothetical protein